MEAEEEAVKPSKYDLETAKKQEIVKKFTRMTGNRGVGMRDVLSILTGPDILPMLEELIDIIKNNTKDETNAEELPSLRDTAVASAGGRDHGSHAGRELSEPMMFDAPYLVN